MCGTVLGMVQVTHAISTAVLIWPATEPTCRPVSALADEDESVESVLGFRVSPS